MVESTKDCAWRVAQVARQRSATSSREDTVSKSKKVFGSLVIIGALAALSGCEGAEEFCRATNDLFFSSHGECVSHFASLPAQTCPEGPGHGQCVSGLQP